MCKNSTKVKKYSARNAQCRVAKFFTVYFLAALIMFCIRYFLPEAAWMALPLSSCAFAIGMALCFGRECFLIRQDKEKAIKKGRLYSCIFFACGVAISIPLMFIGDFLCEKSGLGYGISPLYSDNYVLWLFFYVIMGGIFQELFLRRGILKLSEDIVDNRFSKVLYACLYGLFFLDVMSFFAFVLMAVIFDKVHFIGRNNVLSVSSSVVFNGIYIVLSSMLNIDSDASSNIGVAGLIGMFMVYSSFAGAVMYFVWKKISKKRGGMSEGLLVGLLLVLSFILGWILTAI